MSRSPRYLFLYSSLLVSVAAMVMSYESIAWAQATVNTATVLPFIGCSTFTAYMGYWHISHVYAQSNLRTLRLQRVFLIVGASLSFTTAMPLLNHFIPIALLTLLGAVYASPFATRNVLLKKIVYFKSALLALIWAIATCLLPLWPIKTETFGWIFIARFSLIYALCILFDLRDLERDKKNERWNYLHHISPRGAGILYYITLSVYLLSIAVLQTKGEPSTPYYWGYVPGILAAGLFPIAKHTRNPYFYYGLIDGLMMLSGLLLLLDGFK